MNTVGIAIDYIGSVLSVNHYKNGYYTKRETKRWMEELGWAVKTFHIENWKLPLSVTCSGKFKDARSAPDLSNLSKVILDALQEVSGVNDKDMRWHDGERTLGASRPELIITISESEK